MKDDASYDEKDIVAFSALLHDIGKFYQRAELPHNPHFSQLSQNDFGFCGAHAKWSASFVRNLELPKIIEDIILYHHNPSDIRDSYKGLCNIIIDADHYSSAERIKSERAEDVKKEPLISVFSQLSVDSADKTPFYYAVEALRPLELQMPKQHKKEAFSGWKITPDYLALWKTFEKECIESRENLTVDNLLMLLEKYTTYMPAAAYVSKPDISLYDHLKTTCAIAVASYNFGKEQHPKTKNKWLFIGGSLSGIQRHIYNLKNSKHTLKMLRGRSFSLELITECIINKLIESLGLYRANVIYSGGGNFYILCQNTSYAIDTINEIRTATNKELFNRYGSTLYAILDYVEIEKENFNDYSNVWKTLQEKIIKRKGKKYLEEINQDKTSILGPFDDRPDEEKCSFCGKGRVAHVLEDQPICAECQKMIDIGKKLVHADGFVLIPNGGANAFFGYELKFLDIKNTKNRGADSVVYRFNEFIDIIMPGTHVFYPFGKYYSSYGGELKTTDVFAKEAIGANRLATVRMDVDNLGHIFTEALRPASLSRMATLSRFLKYFFGSYLNAIAEANGRGNNSGLNVAIVYSGGDDVFFVGSWDDCLDYMFLINEQFKLFSCNKISLSAGMVQNKEKYPIFKSAQDASQAEQRAKDNGRDSVTLFGKTHKWNEAIRLRQQYLETMLALSSYDPKKNAYKCVVSPSTFYKIYELSQQFENKHHLVLSPLVYLATRQKEFLRRRGIRSENIQKVDDFFNNIISNPQDIKKMQMPLLWILSYMREGNK